MSVDRKEGLRDRRGRAGLSLARVDYREIARYLAALCREAARRWRLFDAGLATLSASRTANPTSRGHRRPRHAFRPDLAGFGSAPASVALEGRVLMSTLPGLFFLKHTKPGFAYEHNQPKFVQGSKAFPFPVASPIRGTSIATQTAHGGQSVVIGTPDGSHFIVSLTQFIPPAGEGTNSSSVGTSSNVPGTQNPIQGQIPGSGVVQPIGTVRAYAMPGGKVGIIVDGTNTQSELDISPYPFKQRKGYAHSFAYGQTNQSHILDIGQITVNSGVISAILGYHTADLSGPLTISGTATVDRLAFDALKPGASITTGGNLNTLDVLNGIDLNSGTGIHVGGDLNLMNVGQNVSLTNGASLFVGRFLGVNLQPPKGTAPGANFLATNQALLGTGSSTTVPGLSGNIVGNFTIGAGSSFTVVSGIANTTVTAVGATATPAVFLVDGALNVGDPATGINISNLVASNSFNPLVFGTPPNTTTVNPNLVARAGSNLPTPPFFPQSQFSTS
jgi:hypothetical protein